MPPTISTPGSGAYHVGQVVYVRVMVRSFENDQDGTRCAMVEYVGRDAKPDADAFPRLYMVPESHLVPSRIVAEDEKGE